MSYPVFMVSLDCEGKWGMADRITQHHDLMFTSSALQLAYAKLLGLFDSYDLSATFAFVGALTLTLDEYRAFRGYFFGTPARRRWCSRFSQDYEQGSTGGWLEPGLLALVQSRARHEIASHGFTHLPGTGTSGDLPELLLELQAVREWATLKGIDPKTYVYPRNVVHYVDVLSRSGYIGYRGCLTPSHGYFQRFLAVAKEFNIYSHAQPHGCFGSPVAIPPGYMFNWRHGVRKRVPAQATVLKWRHIINHAIEQSTICHLWLHPHNLIDGDREDEVLESVLAYAHHRKTMGDLRVMTQMEYCRQLDLHPALTV